MHERTDPGRRPVNPTGIGAGLDAVRVFVLGPLIVQHRGRALHIAGSHRRRLLALLASRAGQVVPAGVIVDSLWGDDPPATAARTVQSHVARLRNSLAVVDREMIETVAGGYRLALDPAAVDAASFEQLAIEGRRRLAVGDHAGAIAVLGQALAMWRGPAYTEFADVQFAVVEVVHLDELRRAAIEDFAEAGLESGALVSATADLERLVAESPGRERAWGLLMRALYAAGRQHDALVAFQRARLALAEEFGLDPGVELRALERQILEQDPGLTVRHHRTVPAGLRREPNTLVGRDRERAWLIEAWTAARRGSGQLRMLLGAADSGRTRLAAELAAVAIGEGGDIVYVRAADGFDEAFGLAADDGPASPGALIDLVSSRGRRAPLLIVLDDAEWSSATTVSTVAALAGALEHMSVLLVVIADPASSGPAIHALTRTEESSARTLTLDVLSDPNVARIITEEGVDEDGVTAIVAVAHGLPGVARREAALWSERVAGDRLQGAAATSFDAFTRADRAEESVLGEVLHLVAARARRHALANSSWLGRQPYRALAAYEAEDVELFVGRERLVAELVARVLDRRLVVVVGPSGSGKSSVCRAGLIPLVQSGRLPGQMPWRATVIVPGRDPVEAFESVPDLDETGPQLVVLDQFEEAFGSDPSVVDALAGRLIDLALDPALDAHVVLVVRSDQYRSITASPRLAEAARGGQVFVGPPRDEEVRRIIEEPALRTGCTVEPELVELATADVAGRDFALPLLSVALAEVWRRRDHETLRARSYLSVGGLAASVERLGGQAVEVVGPDGVEDLRRLLLLLADVTDDGTWVRRRLEVEQIPDDLGGPLAALIGARLVARDNDTVEVVHEVVFSAWPQLTRWLDEARADLVIDRDVRVAARAWESAGRSDDDVLRGARLIAAEGWATRNATAVAPSLTPFLVASREASDREQAQLRDQLARQTKARRRFGRLLVGACVLLVVAVLAGALALVGQRRAQDERARADSAAETAQARQRDAESANASASAARQDAESERDTAAVARLVAESERALDRRLDLALLLGVEARRHADTVDTRGALLTALTSNVSADRALSGSAGAPAEIVPTTSSFRGFLQSPLRVPFDVDVSDDGQTVAVVGSTHVRREIVMAVFDTERRVEIFQAVQEAGSVWLDLSPDGESVLVFGPNWVEYFGTRDNRRHVIASASTDDDMVLTASFAPDGRTFVVVRADGSIQLYDAQTGDPIDVAVPPTTQGVVGFAPDGTVAIGVDGPAVVFWDPARREITRTVPLELPSNGRFEFTFSPDAALLVGSTGLRIEGAGQVLVWDLASGQLVGDPGARPGLVRGAPAFVSDRIVALGRVGQGLTFYDLDAEQVIGETLDVHGGDLRDIAATLDGLTLVSVADDNLIALWGTNDSGLIDEPAFPGRDFSRSDDGSRYVVITAAGTAEVRQTEGVKPPVAIRSPHGVGPTHDRADMSADGSRVLVLADDSTRTFVADAVTGEPLWTNDADRRFGYIGMSPDGGTVYAAEQNRTVLVAYDVDSGRVVATVNAADLQGNRIDFDGDPLASSDGRYIDIPSSGAHFRFDAGTLEPLGHIEMFGRGGGVMMGNAAEIPETDDIVFAGTLGYVTRLNMAQDLVEVGRSRESSSLENIAVSPDGSMIAARHALSAQVTIFDIAALRPIGRPIPTGDGHFIPAFTTEGDLVANGLFGVSIWNLDPDFWQDQACLAAGRNLTRTEWTEYLGDEPYRTTCPQWPPAA